MMMMMMIIIIIIMKYKFLFEFFSCLKFFFRASTPEIRNF